jgi:enoyl-CoA hydratase
MPPSYEALELSQADGIAEIRLTRPDLLNRVDAELHRDLTKVLRAIAQDAGVRCVVISSTGRAFSAGGDFELMQAAQASADSRRAIVDEAKQLVDALLDIPQPVVAAVQGAAIGLGATIVLLCDVVVAARSATLADSHVAIGLVAGDGGCLAWPQATGMLRARRYLLTGDPVNAETGYLLGLVTDLVSEPDEVLAAARAIAGRIARLAPLAVQGTKRALNQVSRQRAGEVLELSLALEEQTLGSDDLLEGIAAFRERRSPSFEGS